jgi:hypothetical protein
MAGLLSWSSINLPTKCWYSSSYRSSSVNTFLLCSAETEFRLTLIISFPK